MAKKRSSGSQPDPNPFRVGGVVTPPFFADRESECARVRRALTEPQAHLLLYGPRRMGKTSILQVVQEDLERSGHPVVATDLSTVSALADVATRLLQATARALGRRWRDVLVELLERVRLRLHLEPDAATGLVLPSLDVSLRDADLETQRRSLSSSLDALEGLAAARNLHVGVILDEFQELHRFGGEAAEWHLRGIVQQQRHVTYVLAGSHERLIERMLDRRGALYQLLEPLHLGPIAPDYLANWIEERCRQGGVHAEGVGDRIVALAGPRTRDIVYLARVTFELARPASRAMGERVDDAFRQIIAAEDPLRRGLWNRLSALQQNVLRALAVSARGLTTKDTRRRFGLGATGAATKTALTLVERDLLVKLGTSYHFDSPFFRGWVLEHTLGDVGMTLPITHAPTPPPS